LPEEREYGGAYLGLEFLGAEFYDTNDSFENLDVLSVEMKEDKRKG